MNIHGNIATKMRNLLLDQRGSCLPREEEAILFKISRVKEGTDLRGGHEYRGDKDEGI